MPTRRQFLRAGLAGSVLLAGLGAGYGARYRVEPLPSTSASSQRDPLLAALVGAVLAPVLPAAPEARRAAIGDTVSGVKTAIAGLSAAMREEVDDLFRLLDFAPARGLLARIWSRWEDATPEQVHGFLTRWRHSRFLLLRSAYAGVHDLVLGAWYAQPAAWEAIGYPGPPFVE